MIPVKEQTEFLGAIIDIFEDIVTCDIYSDPDEVYFVGKKYDDAVSALRVLMIDQNVFSEAKREKGTS